MNCNDFELIVLALARNQQMDASLHVRSLAHAESCVSCAGRLASERILIAGMRAVVAEMATKEAPPRVKAALLAAFHNEVLASPSPTVIPMPARTSIWSFWKPAAMAASILILIATMAAFWSYSNSLNDGNGQQTGLSAPLELPMPPPAPIELGVNRPNILADARPQDRTRRRLARRKANHPEQVTEFYPLIEGEDLDSSAVSQVVRVELPASALSAAGLSVDPEISTVPVKADIALGYDGLALAVRFVR